MKIKLDENLPRSLSTLLNNFGYDGRDPVASATLRI
jgi:hypothetical protein